MHDIEQPHLSTNTGNLVIDAFVSNHMSIAHNENINFNTDIQSISGSLPISDYDFSIILGNLLDNSLNACRKISCSFPRQISVTLFTSVHKTSRKNLFFYPQNFLLLVYQCKHTHYLFIFNCYPPITYNKYYIYTIYFYFFALAALIRAIALASEALE